MTYALLPNISAAGGSPTGVVLASVAATNMTRPRPAHMPIAVPYDELFFWTRAWRVGERESAAEREAGNLHTFDTPRDLVNWLSEHDGP